MSFAKTVPQMIARTKTVTRRAPGTWSHLKPGEILTAIEKGQGLKKGSRQRELGRIRVLSVRLESLDSITPEECAKEGFPDLSPADFVSRFLSGRGLRLDTCRRIEFEHLPEASA